MSVLEQAIGWLAPAQCLVCGTEGAALCAACSTSEIIPFGNRCWHCSAISPRARACPACRGAGGPRAVWISTNYEGTAKELMRLYKFGQLRAAGQPISDLMVANFLDFHRQSGINFADYLVVPVPTATSRIRQRGFDHSLLLAKAISKNLGLNYELILGRLGQGRQLGSNRAQRLAHPSGDYFVKRPAQAAGRNILLVDDVITTGGTIIECAKVLRTAGAQHVDAITFAKKL